jgi:hypothetical protein
MKGAVWGISLGMTEKPYVPDPSEENDIDFDSVAIEQIEENEPDELDGPAADLDRVLDDPG